jgi:branched-chain amino acid transport system ATP-binding protein
VQFAICSSEIRGLARKIFRIFDRLSRQCTSLLLVEQNACAAPKVADYGYVIEQGEIVLESAASDLAKDSRIATAHLGRLRRSE